MDVMNRVGVVPGARVVERGSVPGSNRVSTHQGPEDERRGRKVSIRLPGQNVGYSHHFRV